MKKNFYNSKEVQDLLSIKGYWIEHGKVPVKFFHEKYPYIDLLEDGKIVKE